MSQHFFNNSSRNIHILSYPSSDNSQGRPLAFCGPPPADVVFPLFLLHFWIFFFDLWACTEVAIVLSAGSHGAVALGGLLLYKQQSSSEAVKQLLSQDKTADSNMCPVLYKHRYKPPDKKWFHVHPTDPDAAAVAAAEQMASPPRCPPLVAQHPGRPPHGPRPQPQQQSLPPQP